MPATMPATKKQYPSYVILGSGGHTAEMCKINQALLGPNNTDNRAYMPVIYVYATSDTTSFRKLSNAMMEVGFEIDAHDFIKVPRSREVGQSWFTTIFTTLWSLFWSSWLIWRDQPKLILCNGPGTCVPYCIAAYLWRMLGRLPSESKIVFVESFCRVRTLSLSGRILLPFADLFIVQWPLLAERYKHKNNIRYFGRIF